MTIGKKVRLLRKRARMTQADLAEKISVTTRAVIYFEKDQRHPSEDVISKLAEVFNISEDILDDDRRNLELTKEEKFIQRAKSEDQKSGKTEAERFLEKCRVFFAGGSVSEDDMDLVFESLTEIFFDAKRKAKEKYGNKPTKDQ